MATGGINAELGREQFLNLLVTQLRSQDPLEPTTNEEFIAQLAQFSVLEGIEELNANFTEFMSLQQLTQGSALIGQTVSFVKANEPNELEGVVSAVQLQEGSLVVEVDDELIPIGDVRSVKQ